MAYMLLIHEEVGQRETRTPAEGEAVYQRMVDWAAKLKSEGRLLSGESLKSLREATRVRTGARPLVLDGPFAEAKEMVGGFFLLNCDTKQEAIKLAQTCPAAEWATVEVRALGPCFV
ncbi:MAG TPA: YciI family protein [Ramlibacter sp.]|nr:YciI family protein [Ramlibacter sp.]